MTWRTLAAQVLKDVIGRIIVAGGIHLRLFRGKAVVVAFHSVTPDLSDGALRCSVRDFERYCTFFSKHLKVVPFTRLVDQVATQAALSGELSITFDDGYADNVDLALPVLERLSLPATFFVTTGFVESQTQAFWDRDAGIRSVWMSWTQVLQLAKAGHEIGAHTVSHADLSKTSAPETEMELRLSRDELMARTGVAPIHFAVPFGRVFSSLGQIVDSALALGFKSVSTCCGGVVDPSRNLIYINRWPIIPNGYLSPYGWIVDVIRECARDKIAADGR
jgi:peptidoglycan/xylan/chitin deacetylase (PgdA/CDA1 family)